MACRWVQIKGKDGKMMSVHLNMAKPRARKCSVCGGPARWLCDYPAGSKTCDKPICDEHRRMDGDRDYCQVHDLTMPLPPLVVKDPDDEQGRFPF